MLSLWDILTRKKVCELDSSVVKLVDIDISVRMSFDSIVHQFWWFFYFLIDFVHKLSLLVLANIRKLNVFMSLWYIWNVLHMGRVHFPDIPKFINNHRIFDYLMTITTYHRKVIGNGFLKLYWKVDLLIQNGLKNLRFSC